MQPQALLIVEVNLGFVLICKKTERTCKCNLSSTSRTIKYNWTKTFGGEGKSFGKQKRYYQQANQEQLQEGVIFQRPAGKTREGYYQRKRNGRVKWVSCSNRKEQEQRLRLQLQQWLNLKPNWDCDEEREKMKMKMKMKMKIAKWKNSGYGNVEWTERISGEWKRKAWCAQREEQGNMQNAFALVYFFFFFFL